MAWFTKMSKEEARRLLGDVPSDKVFRCHDGKVIRNLRELERALHEMSDETFYYHSGKERKDFSNWLRDVVGDEKLANELSKAKSRAEAGRAVAKKISLLEKKM